MRLISIKHTIGDSLMVILLALACMCIGCAYLSKDANNTRPVKKAQLSEKSTHFVHTIQWPGETLSIIAKWYTGSSSNWGALAKANPKLNPNLIRIGDKISIPKGLIKNQEPMPRSFLSSSSPKEDQTVSPPASKESEPKETEPKKMLYAPI